MHVMTGSGLLSSTIASVSSVLGPLQRSVSLPDSQPEKQGAWTRARQGGSYSISLSFLSVNWIMLSTHGVTLRIKGTQSVQYRQRRT